MLGVSAARGLLASVPVLPVAAEAADPAGRLRSWVIRPLDTPSRTAASLTGSRWLYTIGGPGRS